ncbi:MAG TPA: AMP-binding protein [Burkholderiales bacterium]|nr:AMP-binding protein [Burkholderiales bacterium]
MFEQARRLTVGDCLRKQAVIRAGAIALEGAGKRYTYAELDERVNRLANALARKGIARGVRIAILSENQPAYLELELAAARLGAIVACLNWRLAAEELAHCIALASPALLLTSARYAPALAGVSHHVPAVMRIEHEYDSLLAAGDARAPDAQVDPEDGLVILYTSGTTGLPKGALISQRAMVARAMSFAAEFGITAEDTFYAWSPLYHMAGTDFSLATLMLGGKVLVRDGLAVDDLCAALESERLGWLVAVPGMIEGLIGGLKARRPAVRSLKLVGAMADLVPRHQIAELTALLGAPYLNTFGSTETGLPPASAGTIPAGEVPASLAKRESSWCELRLVDPSDRDVAPGVPGEMLVRGPTLFSGYWNAPETNAREFRGGWFHLGDMFVRNADGTLEFVDRLKYLIKSGGENIYPAEIERVLLAHPQVADAVVVRRRDERWGEVPVAFAARRDPSLGEAELLAACRERLAHYKVPKQILFVNAADLPRSSTGKIQRHEVEKWLLPD